MNREGSTADLGISLMLLGSITFMMATFYLVNHRDKMMQQNAWRVISSTISIFSAVLLFQAVNGVVEYYFMEGVPLWVEFRIDIIHMLCWFVILQLMLGVFSGAFGYKPKSLAEMRMNMKTFAVLLGHITGFSAINAWATFQQIMYSEGKSEEEGTPSMKLNAAMVVPIAYVCMSILYVLTEGLRMKVATADSLVDKYELFWMEATQETENDVTGLAISFLVVQVLRLVIGGWLPDAEGEEPMSAHHSKSQSAALLGVSLVLAFIKGKIKPIAGFHRTYDVSMLVLAMSCAWCFFFSASWLVENSVIAKEHGAIVALLLALISTFASFAMIFALEQIESRYKGTTPESVERAIHAVIEALGILVGFSWEHSFDAAIKNIADEVHFISVPITKLGLAIGLFSLVGPAWRLYILPGVLALEEEEDEAKERAEIESDRFYAKLLQGTVQATEQVVRGSLAFLPIGHRTSAAEDRKVGVSLEAMKEEAREELEEMERAMKIEALQVQHQQLAEQSMALAHRMAQLGMPDALEEKERGQREADRAAALESTLHKMHVLHQEREAEIAKLNSRIMHLEGKAYLFHRSNENVGAESQALAEAAQEAEAAAVDASGLLVASEAEVLSLQAIMAAKDYELGDLRDELSKLRQARAAPMEPVTGPPAGALPASSSAPRLQPTRGTTPPSTPVLAESRVPLLTSAGQLLSGPVAGTQPQQQQPGAPGTPPSARVGVPAPASPNTTARQTSGPPAPAASWNGQARRNPQVAPSSLHTPLLNEEQSSSGPRA